MPMLFILLALCAFSSVVADDAHFNSMDIGDDLARLEELDIVESVEHQRVPVSVHSGGKTGVAAKLKEETLYAVQETRVGYAKLVRTGVTVQVGTHATMTYHMRFRGISSSTLAKKDKKFVEALSRAENSVYQKKKKNYRGGLDVPYLKFLGIHLNGSSNKKTQADHARYTKGYNKKAAIAKAILEDLSKSAVVVSGHITATGISFQPTTAFAFIEAARVKLANGKIVTVVSSNKSALSVRSGGKQLPSSDKALEVNDDPYYFEPKN